MAATQAGLYLAIVVLATALLPAPASAEQLTLASDMVLDPQALLMPRGSTYGPAINGIAHQTEALLTVGGYQYATWYHKGPHDEYVYVARRDLSGNVWQVIDDLDITFDRGDANAWNNHNVVAMGVSSDGVVHLSYDHHGHTLRYTASAPGAATSAAWGASLFGAERSSLNVGGAAVSGVTYPRFISNPATGEMVLTYRTGGSGNGELNIATYDPQSGVWNAPHVFIDGDMGVYTDPLGSSSSRNAYLNGVDIEPSGRMHTTWTWRESAGGTNHDILYAYSDDGGDTWKNNQGVQVATPGSPMHLDSPGINVLDMDRRNTLMNQQTQIVDPFGGVHAVMWHASDANANSVNGFTAAPAAYYHYYRQPGETLLADYFDGDASLLHGATPDRVAGGATWEAGDTFRANGAAQSTVSAGPSGQAAHLDFVPEAGRVYTAEATILNQQANWLGFGFLPESPASGDWTQTNLAMRHSNATGYGWMLTRDSSGNDQEGFLGGGTASPQPWNGDVVDPSQPVDMKVVLDTRAANWTVEWFLNGESLGAPVAYASTGNPGIGGVGFSHDRSGSANDGATLLNFTLKEGEGIGEWVRNELPTERAVGSRADMGSDSDGNLYAVYVSPGAGDGQGVTADYYTNGDLIVAAASRASSYQDWEIVYTDERDFVSEPRLDSQRLLQDGVISVYLQENGANTTGPTGSPLRVLEFYRFAQNLVWAGDNGNVWLNGGSDRNWDSQGNDRGDALYAQTTPFGPSRVTFDDGATNFQVSVGPSVAPGSTTFRNTPGNDYTLTGDGIGGAGNLRVMGGGKVTLANAANTFSGDTLIEKGRLVLTGAATLSHSPTIRVSGGATLDVAGLSTPFTVASGQVLVNEESATVVGEMHAASGAVIEGAGVVSGSVTLHSGATFRVGGDTIDVGFNLGQARYIDATAGVGGNTTRANGSVFNPKPEGVTGADNDWEVRNNGTNNGSVFEAGGETAENAYELKTTLTGLVPGQQYLVHALFWDALSTVEDWNIRSGFSSNPGGNTLFSSPDATGDLGGATAASLASTIDFADPVQLAFSNVQLRAGLIGSRPADASGRIEVYLDDLPANFGANRRTWYDGLAVSSISPAQSIVTSLIDGDYEQHADARLEIGIYAAEVLERLVVSGTLLAGGTLSVSLFDEAPTPNLGDAFQILEFGAASGEFNDFSFPLLAGGLGWDTTKLLTTGVLSVGIAGDYNGDGAVDAADYTVWRDSVGGEWIPNRESSISGVVGTADYLVWRDNFGLTVGANSAGSAAVPEPTTLLPLLIALIGAAVATPSRTTARVCR